MEIKLALISALFVAAVLLFGCTSQPQQAPATGNSGAGTQAGGNQPPAQPNKNAGTASLVGTKFVDWKYYAMAVPIAPGQISPQVQAALNVFTVQQSQQADGSTIATVTDNQDKVVSNFTVSVGQTLYFSDGFAGDDVANESDGTLIDDHFVLVDGNGTIVEALSTP